MARCPYWNPEKKVCLKDEIRESWKGKTMAEIAEGILADCDRLQQDVERMKTQRAGASS